MATGQQLQHAYDLIKTGQKQHAANLLTVLLVSDPQNADAWWLLALAAPTAEIMRRALCRVLELRPDDMRARQLLDSLGVRQVMAEGRAAALHMQHAPLPAYPAATLEPRQTTLRRRNGSRVSIFRQRRSTSFFVVLTMAVLFGIAGCGLLSVAIASGVQLVGRTFAGFQPSLPLPVVEVSPQQTELGDINSMGNTGYAQFRGGVFNSPSDRHAYTFEGAVGDLVAIEVATPDSVLDPAVALYAPDGRLIAVSSASDADARLSVTLPASGRYTIVITSQGLAGSYQLSLRH